MNKHNLKAEKREVLGRKVKKLREKGLIPSNVYGRSFKSMPLSVDYKEFQKTFQEAGETGLVEIEVGGEKRPVLIHNIQKDPVTDKYVHVDFLQVDLKQKVAAEVPVEVIGESPVEKEGRGTVVQYINEIEVESLPTDLPEKFEVDASKLLEVGDLFSVKDLVYDSKKVEVKSEADTILAKVEPPQKEEVIVEPKAEEETEVLSESESKTEDEAEAPEKSEDTN